MIHRFTLSNARVLGVQANNLIADGYELTVWNRNKDKCKPLEEKGAKVALDSTTYAAVLTSNSIKIMLCNSMEV